MWMLNIYFISLYLLALSQQATWGIVILAAMYGYLSTLLEHINS